MSSSGLCLFYTCFILFGSKIKIVFQIKTQFCPLHVSLCIICCFCPRVPQPRPGMICRLLYGEFVAIFFPMSIFMISYNHKVTFDIGLEDLRKIKVSYQFIVYINELIKLLF